MTKGLFRYQWTNLPRSLVNNLKEIADFLFFDAQVCANLFFLYVAQRPHGTRALEIV